MLLLFESADQVLSDHLQNPKEEHRWYQPVENENRQGVVAQAGDNEQRNEDVQKKAATQSLRPFPLLTHHRGPSL